MMLLNLAIILQQEGAIHILHNLIPHNAKCKMLEIRMIKNFNIYDLRAKLPPLSPSVKGGGGGGQLPPLLPCLRCP